MQRGARKRAYNPVLLVLIAVVSVWFPRLVVEGGDTFPPEPEFSCRLVVSVNGKQRQAQVFGKGDRLRLEYKYAVRGGEHHPTRPKLSGETTRTLIGPAMVADRPSRLFDVQTERHGRGERFYEWVDEEMDIVLKLVSQDRDWSFQYERIRKSPQPAMYFEGPPGYKKRASSTR